MIGIAANYRPLLEKLRLNSFDSVTAFFTGQEHPLRTGVLLRQEKLGGPGEAGLTVYYKQYGYRPPTWNFLGRPSKARCEFQNYGVFQKLGIPCAEPIAYGERRDRLGRLRCAFILTRAIPEAVTLPEFVERHCPLDGGPETHLRRVALRHQLAAMTQRIHGAGFFHNDLVWRNILVTWQTPGEPKLWWIDCPRGREHRRDPWRRRARWKDLASLDKVAARLCTRAERAAFLRDYLGERRLNAQARQLLRQVESYRKRRWPEDWAE